MTALRIWGCFERKQRKMDESAWCLTWRNRHFVAIQTGHTAEERKPQRKAWMRCLPQIQGGPQIGSEGFPERKKEICWPP